MTNLIDFRDHPALQDTDPHGRLLTRWSTIRVRLDAEREAPAHARFVGSDSRASWRVRRVHVLSLSAGGEIRSYELDSTGALRLALPCHGGQWPEMDREVARVVGARSLVTYPDVDLDFERAEGA